MRKEAGVFGVLTGRIKTCDYEALGTDELDRGGIAIAALFFLSTIFLGNYSSRNLKIA